MKKFLLLGAASLMFSTVASAASGTLTDLDGSNPAYFVTYSTSTTGNNFEDAAPTLVAAFTLHASVTKICAISGVDDHAPGLNGSVDVGTIGISAGDDQAVGTLFNMTGPASVNLHAAAAGCNSKNSLTLAKNDIRGLVNTNPGSYDSDQFQANIPYSVDASFTGVGVAAGPVAGTLQHVTVSTTVDSGSGNFGAWRSPLDIAVAIPTVAGKGLVGGNYDGTLTLTLALN